MSFSCYSGTDYDRAYMQLYCSLLDVSEEVDDVFISPSQLVLRQCISVFIIVRKLVDLDVCFIKVSTVVIHVWGTFVHACLEIVESPKITSKIVYIKVVKRIFASFYYPMHHLGTAVAGIPRRRKLTSPTGGLNVRGHDHSPFMVSSF